MSIPLLTMGRQRVRGTPQSINIFVASPSANLVPYILSQDLEITDIYTRYETAAADSSALLQLRLCDDGDVAAGGAFLWGTITLAGVPKTSELLNGYSIFAQAGQAIGLDFANSLTGLTNLVVSLVVYPLR